jgi:hypothetical protein
MFRKFLLISTAILALTGWKHGTPSGAPVLPSGVTLINTDGGQTYHADNGFSNAIAQPANPFNGLVFATGWDSPNFFALGWSTEFYVAGTLTQWPATNAPVAWSGTAVSGQLNNFLAAGITHVASFPDWQSWINNDRTPGSETVGIFGMDEPESFEQGWQWPIIGIPTTTFTANGASCAFGLCVNWTTTPTPGPLLSIKFCGAPTAPTASIPYLSGTGIAANTTFACGYATSNAGGGTTGQAIINTGTWSSTTVTQQAVPGFDHATGDGRFSYLNFTVGWTRFGTIGGKNGSIPATTAMGTFANAPSGKKRWLDWSSIDNFVFSFSRCASMTNGGCNDTLSSNWDTGLVGLPMNEPDAARGPHYGDYVDFQRAFQSSSASPTGTPINTYLEVTNDKGGVPYDPQPVEIQWGVWGAIIHGGRGIAYFPQLDFNDPSNCAVNGGQNSDALYCPFMRTQQSVTTTSGSISGNTLTVSAVPTGNGIAGFGMLAPGMKSTSGVTGNAVTILQQTLRGSSGSTASFTATFSGTNQTTLTVSGVTGTISVPSMVIIPFPNTYATDSGLPILITAGTGPTYTVNSCTSCGRPAGPVAAQSQPVAVFTGTFSGASNVTLNVAGVSGTIDIPAVIIAPGNSNNFGIRTIIRSGGPTTYTVDANNGGASGATMVALSAPGGLGKYAIVGGGTGSGSMTFQQWGWGNNVNCAFCGAGPTIATGTIDGVTSVNGLVLTMAPVINSQFMKGFIASQSPDRYMFERGMGKVTAQGCASTAVGLQSLACATFNGIDTMAKYYIGTTYTATTGDSISPGFYIFATTNHPETSTAISATFNLCAACTGFTTADVIGESRSRPISAGSFTDTFANAWTTHIYKVH